MKEKYTYIDIFKKLEDTLPATSEFDYTKVSPDDLWKKIDAFITEIGLKDRMEENKLRQFKAEILYALNSIYIMTQLSHSGNSSGFDQNNYFIVKKILEIKNKLYSLLGDKQIVEYVFPPFNKNNGYIGHYSNRMGTDEELEKYLSPESIRNYITSQILITKDDKDIIVSKVSNDYLIRHIGELGELLYANTLYHFGIFGKDYPSRIIEITRMFEYALLGASTNIGKHNSDGSYDKVTHDQANLYECLKPVIDEIVSYVAENSRLALDARKNRNVQTPEFQNGSSVEISDKNTDNVQDESIVGIFEKSIDEAIPETIHVNDNNEVQEAEDSPLEVDEYDALITRAEQLLEVAKKGKQLEQEKARLTARLAAIQQEIDDNKRKLAGKYGS